VTISNPPATSTSCSPPVLVLRLSARVRVTSPEFVLEEFVERFRAQRLRRREDQGLDDAWSESDTGICSDLRVARRVGRRPRHRWAWARRRARRRYTLISRTATLEHAHELEADHLEQREKVTIMSPSSSYLRRAARTARLRLGQPGEQLLDARLDGDLFGRQRTRAATGPAR